MKLLLLLLTPFILTGCLSLAGIMGSFEPSTQDRPASFGLGITFNHPKGKENK